MFTWPFFVKSATCRRKSVRRQYVRVRACVRACVCVCVRANAWLMTEQWSESVADQRVSMVSVKLAALVYVAHSVEKCRQRSNISQQACSTRPAWARADNEAGWAGLDTSADVRTSGRQLNR